MDLNVKSVKITERLAFFTVKEHTELSATINLSHGLLGFIFGEFQMRCITAVNNETSQMYELKQTNFLIKLLCCTVLLPFCDFSMQPAHNFYINGVRYGKFIQPLAVIDGKEYEFRYKKDIFEFSCHRPNTIAVLKNGIQVMKMQFMTGSGEDYLVKYDPKYITDIMLIFILTVCIDNAIFPADWTNMRVFGENYENYPERVEWLPSDEVEGEEDKSV